MVEQPQQPAEEPQTERSRLQAMADAVHSMVAKVRTMALLAAGAGLWLWGVIYYPFEAFQAPGPAVGAVLVAVLMLLPAGILLFFHAGLRELARLPQRVSEVQSSGREDMSRMADELQSVRQAGTSRWMIVRLVQAIWALWGVIARHKATLVKYAAAMKLFTAPFLLLVLLSVLVSAVFVVMAAISVPVVLLMALL